MKPFTFDGNEPDETITALIKAAGNHAITDPQVNMHGVYGFAAIQANLPPPDEQAWKGYEASAKRLLEWLQRDGLSEDVKAAVDKLYARGEMDTAKQVTNNIFNWGGGCNAIGINNVLFMTIYLLNIGYDPEMGWDDAKQLEAENEAT